MRDARRALGPAVPPRGAAVHGNGSSASDVLASGVLAGTVHAAARVSAMPQCAGPMPRIAPRTLATGISYARLSLRPPLHCLHTPAFVTRTFGAGAVEVVHWSVSHGLLRRLLTARRSAAARRSPWLCGVHYVGRGMRPPQTSGSAGSPRRHVATRAGPCIPARRSGVRPQRPRPWRPT